jgi:hypothetical protein
VTDFEGHEHSTARNELQGNEDASPVVFGDFAYTGADYDGR